MGMIGYLVRVTPEELAEILNDSSALESKVGAQGSDSGDILDIDKAWEAIFYLLTGHPLAEIEEAKPPLSWSLLSGQFVDENQDLGYGPAHYLTPDQVGELNKALDNITREDLQQRYDGPAMNQAGVYPEVWDEPESRDYVLDYYDQLKDFYKIAEKENNAVITYIS